MAKPKAKADAKKRPRATEAEATHEEAEEEAEDEEAKADAKPKAKVEAKPEVVSEPKAQAEAKPKAKAYAKPKAHDAKADAKPKHSQKQRQIQRRGTAKQKQAQHPCHQCPPQLTLQPHTQAKAHYEQCMAAMPAKPSAFSDGQNGIAVAAKHEGPVTFAMLLNSAIPRDAPYGFEPDWNSCLARVFKRVESHSQVDNNIRQPIGVTLTATVCNLACGQGWEEG